MKRKRAKFNYPKEFTTLPEYTAHAGQVVEVIRPLGLSDGFDGCEGVEPMFLIKADDGLVMHAFESELEEVA